MPYFRKSFILSILLGLISLFYLFSHTSYSASSSTSSSSNGPIFDTTTFKPGVLKPPGSTYTRILVMGRIATEDVSWIPRELPGIQTAIYSVDTLDSNSTIPANKGHEAMAYLTYIIDHYPDFPDVVLFFHPHATAWHNNIIHDVSTITTIKRLNDEHVIRQGYFNSRCHLDPGCPNWLKVDRWPMFYDYVKKPEEPHLTQAVFHELHGKDVSVPKYISQPCCAQFAVSGQRIRERKLEEYVRYRKWILDSELDDATTGRLMEYSWQYIFAGVWEYCPSMSGCYCGGYGVCFGDDDASGEAGLAEWLK